MWHTYSGSELTRGEHGERITAGFAIMGNMYVFDSTFGWRSFGSYKECMRSGEWKPDFTRGGTIPAGLEPELP